jgi:hypothetical protein
MFGASNLALGTVAYSAAAGAQIGNMEWTFPSNLRRATVWAYENHHGNRLRATCSLDERLARLTSASIKTATTYATIIATRTVFQRIVSNRNVVKTAKIKPPKMQPNTSITVSVGALPLLLRRKSFITTNPPPTNTVSTVAKIQSPVGTLIAGIVPKYDPDITVLCPAESGTLQRVNEIEGRREAERRDNWAKRSVPRNSERWRGGEYGKDVARD